VKLARVAAGTALLAACAIPGPTGDPSRPDGVGSAAKPDDVAPAPIVDGGADADGDAAAALVAIAPPYDVASTAAAIDAWPRIIPGVQSRAITSFDRGGGNDDGFGGTWSELYVDARGEHVIVDEIGPGVLRTLWFTSAINGDALLGLGKVRVYFDDEVEPRIAIDSDALYAGATSPFVAPLVAANHVSSGGFASWAPLPYRGRLRVTTEQKAGFYEAHVDTLPADWAVASWKAGADDALAKRFAAGASTATLIEVPLDSTRAGSGTIDVLRFVPAAALDDAALAAARIRIWFDGGATPQIDVPLALFFGSGRGLAPIASVAWTMQPLLLESRLPMPFWSGARIAINGIAGKVFVHVDGTERPRAETGTLEVHARAMSLTEAGKDVVYADVTGSGKLVATVLAIDPETPSTKRWWEGDLRVAVDGARTPVIHGTGHEDDHLGGWSNEFLSRPFTLPMQGCPRTDLLDTGAEFQKNGGTTMYRLWPGISFTNALRQSTEHGAGNGVQTRYAAAAFVYRGPKNMLTVRTDGFKMGDLAAMKSHAYLAPAAEARSLTSSFEGEDGTVLTAMVHDVTGALSFDLVVDPANEGAFLRRLADRGEAPARAALEVDSIPVTTMTTWGPIGPGRAWLERDVLIPAQLTRGKTRIHVQWIPAEGSRSSAAQFEAWSIVQKPL